LKSLAKLCRRVALQDRLWTPFLKGHGDGLKKKGERERGRKKILP